MTCNSCNLNAKNITIYQVYTSFIKHFNFLFHLMKKFYNSNTKKTDCHQSISNRFIIDTEKKNTKLQFYYRNIHFTICRDVRNDMQIKKPQGYLSKYFCVKSLHSKTHHVGIKFNRISLICVHIILGHILLERWKFSLFGVVWGYMVRFFSVCTNRKIGKKTSRQRGEQIFMKLH